MTSRLRPTAVILAALTLLVSFAPPSAAFGAADDDPSLDQTLDSALPIVHGAHVLDAGHVDLGPRFDDGQWRLLIHDDAAKADANAQSAWRYPEETVLRVRDEGQLQVPDDPAYSFLGADPGSTVWVVPQTQNAAVVWLGWNTQDPEVMQRIDRGVTLSLRGVQGPGAVSVYLQSGSFAEPQVLWDSRTAGEQPVWVDVNTHTHANWVFTEPGVYLLRLQAAADLIDGTTAADSQILRFAVGTATSPDDALAATWQQSDAAASPTAAAPSSAASSAATGIGVQNPLVPILIGLIVLVAAGLVVVFTTVIVRGSRARRRVLAAHGGRSDHGSSEGGIE